MNIEELFIELDIAAIDELIKGFDPSILDELIKLNTESWNWLVIYE